MTKANGSAGGSEHEGMISGGSGGSQCNVRNEWAMAIQCEWLINQEWFDPGDLWKPGHLLQVIRVRPSQCNLSPSVLWVNSLTALRTIFAADVVHMCLGKHGLRYIVDLHDKFSGWLEAKALRKAVSKAIAEMIFEVMSWFGCFLKITIDNGTKFKGAVTLLADKYNIPIIPISPYNPSANGIVERGHGVYMYIESIWTILQGNTTKWPEILPLAIWADQVMTKRMTGGSPYSLLYGQQLLFPFDFTDWSWHTLDWVHVNSTKDLLAIRVKQLSHRDEYIGEASAKTEKARLKATEYFFQKNNAWMTSGDYEYGTMVLVWNNALNMMFGNKGALCWSGPYIVVQRWPSGAYVLAELDGAILSKPFAACCLKLYHYHDKIEPIVWFEWKSTTDVEIMNSDDKELEILEQTTFWQSIEWGTISNPGYHDHGNYAGKTLTSTGNVDRVKMGTSLLVPTPQ